jgi:hypothetical protein
MMQALFANFHSPSLREFGMALCLLAFLLGFVLWFIRYVRIDKSESSEWES